MQRDNLDFKNMSVSKLFTKQLFPTLLGMVSSALFTVVDGIFVGRGIGSDAIAAVNIAAPIFMIAAGLGLMFGMGGGILASINLSRGKLVVVNINVTQSIVMLTIVSIIMGILFCLLSVSYYFQCYGSFGTTHCQLQLWLRTVIAVQ